MPRRLQRIRIDALGPQRVVHELLGLVVEQDLAGVGSLLQPRGHSHRIARYERVGGRVPGHHLAGVDAGTQRDRDFPVTFELEAQVAKRVAGLVRRPHRAQRVVLVDCGHAEDPDHAAGRGCLGARAVPLEHLGNRLDRAGHGPAERLRIVRPAEAEHIRRDDRDRLPDLGPRRRLLPRGRQLLPRPELERRIVHEHRPLQPLQRATGLEPELLHEHLARLVVDAQRLGLAARAVEGDHELGPESLAQRMLRDERLQFRDELGVPAGRKLRLDPILGRGQTQLLEPRRLGPRKGRVAEVHERRPAPEADRVPQLLRCLRRRATSKVGPRLLDHSLEPIGVQLLGLDAEQVARAASDEQIGLQQLAQLRDAVLDDLPGRWRRIALPELVDQAIARDDLVCMQEEDRQQLSLARAAQRHLPISRADLEGTEDPVIHLVSLGKLPAVYR